MSANSRRFRNAVRLIVSVETATIAAVDALMEGGRHHGHRNRSEFVRLAIERELARCRDDDFRTRTRVGQSDDFQMP
tara:strand:- start:2623 stop:2853 length:231 start_codon:yes stop_codon:yes gene_type:complete